MFINPLRFKLDKPLVQSLFLFPRQFHCKTKGEKDEEMFTIKSCIFAAMLKGFWISSKHYKCITQDKLPPFFSIHTSPLRLAGELCQNTGTSSNFVRCSKWPVKNMKFVTVNFGLAALTLLSLGQHSKTSVWDFPVKTSLSVINNYILNASVMLRLSCLA